MNSSKLASPRILQARKVYVWDVFVRLFHWSLVLAFFVAYLTEDDAMALHVWAGYAAGGLVVLRIAWGFVGPPNARFAHFVCGPARAWRYLIDLLRFHARRHLGHSPAGGVMVLMLLASVLATVGSGLELYAVEKGKGPLALAPLAPVTQALADDGEGIGDAFERPGERHRGGLWKDSHEFLANLTFLLVLLHVGGVILASIAHRENLTGSMITGWKRAETDGG